MVRFTASHAVTLCSRCLSSTSLSTRGSSQPTVDTGGDGSTSVITGILCSMLCPINVTCPARASSVLESEFLLLVSSSSSLCSRFNSASASLCRISALRRLSCSWLLVRREKWRKTVCVVGQNGRKKNKWLALQPRSHKATPSEFQAGSVQRTTGHQIGKKTCRRERRLVILDAAAVVMLLLNSSESLS